MSEVICEPLDLMKLSLLIEPQAEQQEKCFSFQNQLLNSTKEIETNIERSPYQIALTSIFQLKTS